MRTIRFETGDLVTVRENHNAHYPLLVPGDVGLIVGVDPTGPVRSRYRVKWSNGGTFVHAWVELEAFLLIDRNTKRP